MQKNFIDNLKRDKARGAIAPHQVLLLISLKILNDKKGNFDFNIEEVVDEFDSVWDKYERIFKSKSKIAGMPIKAFHNQGLIDLEFSSKIEDFRNRSMLLESVKTIKFHNNLTEFLIKTELDELEIRIVK